MEYFIEGAIFIGLFAWASISVIVIAVGFDYLSEGHILLGLLITSLGMVSLAFCIAFVFYFGDSDESNKEHCGPGTEYRESMQYSPVTKTAQTNWWCEVK